MRPDIDSAVQRVLGGRVDDGRANAGRDDVPRHDLVCTHWTFPKGKLHAGEPALLISINPHTCDTGGKLSSGWE